MNKASWYLLSILSDAKPHNISTLCQQLNRTDAELFSLVATFPEDIQHRLRRTEDIIALDLSLAIFSQEECDVWAREENISIEVCDELDSTNTCLLQQYPYESGAEKKILLANHQTQGRGTQGRTWVSEIGHSLTFSLAWVFPQAQNQLTALPLVIALSCYRVLKQYGLPVSIKWPNDLVVGDKKLGGILVESIKTPEGSLCVMGMGLNYRALQHYPDTATVMGEGQNLSAKVLFRKLLQALLYDLKQFSVHGFSFFQIDYMAANRDLHQNIELSRAGVPYAKGRFLGVNDKGALLLEREGHVQHIVSGEISLRREYMADLPSFESDVSQYLLLDCGNSQAKWVWVINGRIEGAFRAQYAKLAPLKRFCQLHPKMKGIIGSRVCSDEKKQSVEDAINQSVDWLVSERQARGIRSHYRHPEEHGADRWFNVLGARHFSDHACVVVSCGTAVTIDALTDENQYLGGSILPGFSLMKESMAVRTENLNRPVGRVYPFATTTPNALASGMMDAVVGAIVLMCQRLQEKIGHDKSVDLILTGGGAKKIKMHFPESLLTLGQIKVVDNLVIWGLMDRIKS